MSDENTVLRITEEDIAEANRLSMHCPICAGPVDRFADSADEEPVTCAQCGTFYHKLCWQNNGGKCAVLGCNSVKCTPYAHPSDIPIPGGDPLRLDRVGQENKRHKARERATPTPTNASPPPPLVPPAPVTQGFWEQLYKTILRAFGVR